MADTVAFTRCKGFGHNWDDAPSPPYATPPKAGYVKIFFRCTRCGTEKTYNLNRSTGEGKPAYSYPRDYSAEKASKREWKLLFALNRKHLYR